MYSLMMIEIQTYIYIFKNLKTSKQNHFVISMCDGNSLFRAYTDPPAPLRYVTKILTPRVVHYVLLHLRHSHENRLGLGKYGLQLPPPL